MIDEMLTQLNEQVSKLARENELLMQEIADLKIANQDLKYQLIQKAGEQVLVHFKELTVDEIHKLHQDVFGSFGMDYISLFQKFAQEILKKASEK
jgi:hypothetical protein